MITKAVFDSYTVFRAWVLQPDDFPDEHAAIAHLKENRQHRFCFNSKIENEYEIEFHKNGYPATFIIPAVEELRSAGKLTKIQSQPKVPIQGLSSPHRGLVESAAAGQAKYLVTTYSQWQKHAKNWQTKYGFHVITPRKYSSSD